jgi:IMP dehydrogenase
MKRAISFDDVLLLPQFSEICSRKKEVTLGSNLGNIKTSIPIISSPMDTVTEGNMVFQMDNAGGIGIIHRYNSIEQQAQIVSDVRSRGANNVGVAIGVSGDFIERAQEVIKSGANILCVDIAHGHHIMMQNALSKLRNSIGSSIHVMAGNVATLHGINDLADWGADSVRVGIGGGSICSTRIQTGHGMPTLQSIIECAETDRTVSIIADGGIRNSGDVCKALAAGADFVMLGSMLSGTDESPGEKHYDSRTGKFYKAYRGMASVEAQIDWRGHTSSVEGVASTVDYKGPVSSVLEDIIRGVRSGLSYSGTKTISEFQHRARMIEITSSGMNESRTHILNKQ